MRKSLIYYTENNNSYLYDAQNSFSMLIHPELENAFKKFANIDPYYLKKFAYLKEHGFFKEAEPIDFGTTIDEFEVNNNIINVKQIVFETTDYCNLSCKYCSLGDLYDFSKKDKKNINTNYAINFLKYIFSIKPKGVRFTIGFFGGEPLVNIDFIKKIIQETKYLNAEKKLDLSFNVTTNATLIHKHIQFFVENNFDLLISLDGDEKAQSYRKFAESDKNSYSKVIKNIDMIQQEYPQYFFDKVEFNAVLHNRNSIKEIYDFIYNRYHKIPRIAQLNVDHINPNKKDYFKEIFSSRRKSEHEFLEEGSSLSTIMHKESLLYNEMKRILDNYSINFYLLNVLYLLYDQVNSVPTGTCSPFQRKMFLNTSHNLLPCEKVNYKYSIGEVNDRVYIDISDIAKRYNFYYEEFKEICKDCYMGIACPTCILTLENLDKVGTKEFTCPNFQDQNSFKNKLKLVFSFLERFPNDFFQWTNNLILS